MLDEKDLQALQTMMETIVDTSSKRTENLIENRIAQTEKLIENRTAQAENLRLEELSRTQNTLDKKIETVQRNLDELSQYHRITKLENDNTSLLLQLIKDLKKEVDELKIKIA